ncbi:MAG: NUDIX hydrolase [Candidatus Woesearchaeota archaeon]|nr:MAG: NUDIX hydrolase [Candidatus Woesearchaeota archaeon]
MSKQNQELILVSQFVRNSKNEVLLLFRKDHRHYETPGGKLKRDECEQFQQPREEELKKAAKRELHEEVGQHIKISKQTLFRIVRFDVPDGRKAIAYKFVADLLSGEPILQEPELFDHFKWITIDDLETMNLSPDLKLLGNELKELKKNN